MSNVDFREYQAAFIDRQEDLAHHGIKGMRWGVRRYQNEDGSLTEAGRKHYGKTSDNRTERKVERINKQYYKHLKRRPITMVNDPVLGTHVGVYKNTLKRKGQNAALKEAKNPKIINKEEKKIVSYFDKIYEQYLSNIGSKKEAYEKAMKSYTENTGYTKSTLMKMIKKHSKYDF